MSNYQIVRMYASPDQAEGAVARLMGWGFDQDLINLVTASSTPPANAPASAASDDPVLSSIMAGYVLKAHASVYAAEVHAGRTLVAVQPPFGTGGMAEEILDEYDPVESSLVIARPDAMPLWDEAAPFSSTFQLPVILKTSTSFSSFWGLPVITRRFKSFSALLGLPEVTRSAWYVFGSPTLSRSGRSFSSMLGLPMLTKRK